MKWDREHTVLSVGGGLAVLVIGYLIWRHERAVGKADAAANLDAQRQLDQEQAASINSALAAIPSYAVGGTVTGQSTSQGGVIEAASPTDGLQQILQAFYPPAVSTPVTGPGASGTDTGGATQLVPGNDNSQVHTTGPIYMGAQPPAALPFGYDPTSGVGVVQPGRSINAHIQPVVMSANPTIN